MEINTQILTIARKKKKTSMNCCSEQDSTFQNTEVNYSTLESNFDNHKNSEQESKASMVGKVDKN